jgi:hypothetical protein
VKQIKKAVYILGDTKEVLEALCKKHPDIKMLYFVDNAVKDAIALEQRTRELMKESSNGRPESPSSSPL